MFDYLLNDEQKKLRQEARDFVKSIPRKMILDMDGDKIQFRRNSCRKPEGATSWDADIRRNGAAEIWTGSPPAWSWRRSAFWGIFSPVPSVWAQNLSVTPSSSTEMTPKRKSTSNHCSKGELFAAECLTEPRGGSDFFGTTSTAVDKGDHFLLNGQKRFIVGGDGADYFLVYARTDPDGEPHKSISCFIVDAPKA